MQISIQRFESPELLARDTAALWVGELARQPERKLFCLALSGGRVAKFFLLALTENLKSQPSLRSRVHIFWADERCVPPDDPESNYRLAWESFLQPLSFPMTQIHRIRGECDPAWAAQEAEQELRRIASSFSAGLPVLDYVFLGMGEDGHVASLFPGATLQTPEQSPVFYPIAGPKPPFKRITLSYPMLKCAHEVWVLASGAGKADALKESLSNEGRTPLAKVIHSRAHTRVFTDVPQV
jgi:6-phosphogluconolactonase